MADIARLTQVIEPEAQALGFELVRVKLFDTGPEGDGERTLQVMAEDPASGQLVVEQCMALSRRISDAIDAVEDGGEELIEGTYQLEVSSPGIDRPLTRPKDFANWAGHDVNVSLNEPVRDHRKLRGELLGVEAGQVQIEDRKHGRFAVPFEQIKSAKLVLTDELIAATKPLDMSGADEIVETTEEEKVQD
ncbi:MAG TPA: ribosome maturation protein RimP [Croceibacterium sp.]|nr:ribosome maturation protein RimP [Croceibacterium sp.]